ncbi:hypothetical protein SISNIDRAFT_456660 [Sistotremastrum niveocremeum HHB9708]|uniref:Uncharacterized protein n=2 Tax=Sistotremastraceae TaxID=3402574 RepID=A0A164SEE4_9AGAM|nr:hypothetical protein SISNIDRAFT_456660 [Sistotremastrum niveocremeum HHB9708]KZT33833.1 hypothetical protein SISSUDRAFT_1053760 [Sistotremastrum suecicum HHB10207 ss-3]
MFNKLITSIVLFSSLALSSTAYITGVRSESGHYAKVGYNYGITFETAIDFNEVWDDYSIIFGWSAHPTSDPTSIGSFVGSTLDLTSVGEVSTGSGTFDTDVYIDPKLFNTGKVTTYTLNAAVTSIRGPSLYTFVRFLNTTITVEP